MRHRYTRTILFGFHAQPIKTTSYTKNLMFISGWQGEKEKEPIEFFKYQKTQ